MDKCLASSQTLKQFIRPSSSLSYTSKTDCILKYSLSIESKGLNCNDGSFHVCGAAGDLSFATNEQSNE
jgi:hypothetical protein